MTCAFLAPHSMSVCSGRGVIYRNICKDRENKTMDGLSGTHRRCGEDELVEHLLRPPEASLEAVTGCGLLIIMRVCFAGRDPRGAHEVRDSRSILQRFHQLL
jgi:hypothetical protein